MKQKHLLQKGIPKALNKIIEAERKLYPLYYSLLLIMYFVFCLCPLNVYINSKPSLFLVGIFLGYWIILFCSFQLKIQVLPQKNGGKNLIDKPDLLFWRPLCAEFFSDITNLLHCICSTLPQIVYVQKPIFPFHNKVFLLHFSIQNYVFIIILCITFQRGCFEWVSSMLVVPLDGRRRQAVELS